MKLGSSLENHAEECCEYQAASTCILLVLSKQKSGIGASLIMIHSRERQHGGSDRVSCRLHIGGDVSIKPELAVEKPSAGGARREGGCGVGGGGVMGGWLISAQSERDSMGKTGVGAVLQFSGSV